MTDSNPGDVPYTYSCWKCKPPRTFLTAEAKARHLRTVHGDSTERSRNPDLDAHYDTEHKMFRPGPPSHKRLSQRLRDLLGLSDDDA